MSALRLAHDRFSAPRPREIAVLGPLRLAAGRVHELCGPARHTLAMLVARALEGPVFWIAPDWEKARLMGDGIAPFVDPGRITFLTPGRSEDLLWSVEEALRAGCVPLVVADIPTPPAMTPVRRLHLAAETGGGTALGILLTPGDGGAAGIESRWKMTPRHSATRRNWQLERRRARIAPPAAWTLAHDASGFALTAASSSDH